MGKSRLFCTKKMGNSRAPKQVYLGAEKRFRYASLDSSNIFLKERFCVITFHVEENVSLRLHSQS